MNPFFTVLVPTFRRCHLLPRALNSALGQSYEDFELLVVDDASPDNTAECVAQFADPRVRYLRREANGGPAATRNTGIQAARGAWIALLDDDDEYDRTFLDRTAATVADTPEAVGLTWCGVRWVRDTDSGTRLVRQELWAPRFSNRHEAYLSFLRNRRVGTNCGLCLRRSAFDAVGGFDESLRGGAEDTDLLIRMVHAFEYRVIPEVLITLHLHGGPGLRGVSVEKARDYEKIMLKHSPALESHPDVAAELRYKTGWLWAHAGRMPEARAWLFQALRARPWHARALALLFLTGILGRRAARAHRALSRLRSRREGLSSTPAKSL